MAADELRLGAPRILGPTASCCGVSRSAWGEVILIFALFFLFAGSPPPDVNEAHYLTKAKHFWDSSWCGQDLFLDSADAHPVFYWLFGWMTLWGSLTTVAWLGRVVTWISLAVGWQRLSWVVVPQRYASVATAAMFLVLADRCHLAGEWAVGGLEAKGLAYALVLFGLRSIVLERWPAVWIWMGAATSLHVLVGGWSMVAAGICWALSGARRPPLRAMWVGLLLGSCCALVGLYGAVKLMFEADPATAREASEIYVFGRLAHHLVFHRFALLADDFFRWLVARLGRALVVRPRQRRLAAPESVCRGGLVVFGAGYCHRLELSGVSGTSRPTAQVLLVSAGRRRVADGCGAGNCGGGRQASTCPRQQVPAAVEHSPVVLWSVHRREVPELAVRFSAGGH